MSRTSHNSILFIFFSQLNFSTQSFVSQYINYRVGEVIQVDSMHSRKRLMVESSDAFIAMPGGFGTFDELFEAITWLQLGIHSKPIGCYNINNYFDPFLQLLKKGVESGFIGEKYANIVVVEDDPVTLISRLQTCDVPLPYMNWEEGNNTNSNNPKIDP